jgi:CRISPR type III-B/RAMP module RAMP protein Cmr1
MSGANQQPELRAASFRGVLRYWMRASLGSRVAAPKELLQEESRYYGSTEGGSPLRVRVKQTAGPQTYQPQRCAVLPPDRFFKGYQIGFAFDLIFDVHPLCSPEQVFNDQFWCSLLLAIKFGAFGRRARRAAGAVQASGVIELDNLNEKAQTIAQKYTDSFEVACKDFRDLRNHLTEVVRKVPTSGTWARTPRYPVFHKDHVQVFLSDNGDKDFLKALAPLWAITSSYHHNDGAWGEAIHGRRASAFHIRVHRCANDMYYPLITVFHSGRDWNSVLGYFNKITSSGFILLHGPRGDFG